MSDLPFEHNTRALSKILSKLESSHEDNDKLLVSIFPSTGHARKFGVTGPPGVGKSTVISEFVGFLRREGRKVAILAIDPMSARTQGAILGDRVRMQDHFLDPSVYIRSLSTRGALGGLSRCVPKMIDVLDAYGFDDIFIETVGTGQNETDVADICDLTLGLTMPGLGDDIQLLKSGIVELIDFFIINKGDTEGAQRAQTLVANMLHLMGRSEVPVCVLSKENVESQTACFAEVLRFYEKNWEAILKKRDAQRKAMIIQTLSARASQILEKALEAELSQRVPSAQNPYEFIATFSFRRLFSAALSFQSQ